MPHRVSLAFMVGDRTCTLGGELFGSTPTSLAVRVNDGAMVALPERGDVPIVAVLHAPGGDASFVLTTRLPVPTEDGLVRLARTIRSD